MGQKLVKYYEYINNLMGLQGKQELARLTHVPSIIAGTTPDSLENIQKFRDAVAQITKKEAPNY